MQSNGTSSNEQLIGSAAAAELLGVDRSTLSRWVYAGKISPAIKGRGVRGERFFSRADVEALAATEQTQAASA